MTMNAPQTALQVGASQACLPRFNALRHGILSRYTVLPWEDETEYQSLLGSLLTEHSPNGPTEEHLVEELASIFWRKRRLRLAELAAHHRGLEDTTAPFRNTVEAALAHLATGQQSEGVSDAIRATPEETAEQQADVEEDESMTQKALKILHQGGVGAYEKALAALRNDTREWWETSLEDDPEDLDEDEKPPTPNVDGLQRFLENKLGPWYAQRRKELENRPLIRAQALGEAFDPNKLGQLARYEVHLDRKLERMLSMLLRLKDLRPETIEV
jgi:hypothetical protein